MCAGCRGLVSKLSDRRLVFPRRTRCYGIRNKFPFLIWPEGYTIKHHFHILPSRHPLRLEKMKWRMKKSWKTSRNQCVFQNFWEEKTFEGALRNTALAREAACCRRQGSLVHFFSVFCNKRCDKYSQREAGSLLATSSMKPMRAPMEDARECARGGAAVARGDHMWMNIW